LASARFEFHAVRGQESEVRSQKAGVVVALFFAFAF
jgi:hypothetical protein